MRHLGVTVHYRDHPTLHFVVSGDSFLTTFITVASSHGRVRSMDIDIESPSAEIIQLAETNGRLIT